MLNIITKTYLRTGVTLWETPRKRVAVHDPYRGSWISLPGLECLGDYAVAEIDELIADCR